MKAIVQDAYGSADVLRLDDIEVPTIRPDDVLVRVHAAGVDASVWHLMTGEPRLVRLFGFGLRRPKIRVRGRDVAGVVEAVGEQVAGLAVGDAVFGTTLEGSFAEFTRVPWTRLVRMPAGLEFANAAVIPVSACAALHALRDAGRMQAGESVLVIGAGGGVGSFAVQIATAWGAAVTGVCSTSKLGFVRSLGAARVIDYSAEDFADGSCRYDLILDLAGNSSLTRLRRALSPRGTLVIVGGEGGGRWFGGVDRQLRAGILSAFGKQKMRGLLSSEGADDLAVISDLIADGSIAPSLHRTFPLTQTADAIRYVNAGHALGKVAITV
jgi:NADPH:quinone reductase-like Zn-dependent oxidoreductase